MGGNLARCTHMTQNGWRSNENNTTETINEIMLHNKRLFGESVSSHILKNLSNKTTKMKCLPSNTFRQTKVPVSQQHSVAPTDLQGGKVEAATKSRVTGTAEQQLPAKHTNNINVKEGGGGG